MKGVELELDEHEVLRGGFGGVGIMWTIILGVVLAATVVLVPLALWFWWRSGKYVLTDRRLYWKPSLGKLRVIPLAELAGKPITFDDGTESVFVGDLALRWQKEVFMLWGALAMLTTLRLPDAAPWRGPEERLCVHAKRQMAGLAGAHGVAVLVGDELSFIPYNPGVRPDDRGSSGVIVRTVTLRAQIPVDRLLAIYRALGGDYAAHVRELALTTGGVHVPLRATQRSITQNWTGVHLVVAHAGEKLELDVDEQTARALS